jgi:hypothetical protein
MGHVLGIGTIWQSRGLLSGAGTSNPRFVGSQAVAAYNAIFGTSATGVPVENTGGGGTRDSHWRESIFGNELMTGFLNGGSNPLSRVTVASLADLGYVVNLNAADNYTPPGGGGSFFGGGGGGANLRLAPESAAFAPTNPTAITDANEDTPVEPQREPVERPDTHDIRTSGVWVGADPPVAEYAPATTPAVDFFRVPFFDLD